MSLTTGSRLGAYEITGRVGSGGMGDVYRARDTRIGRDVAVKMLPDDVAGDGDRLRRFEQEARAAGSLNHPNLVTIHEFGTHDGTPYLVMELLDGETLREKLGDGSHPRIPIRKALDYAQQLAAGLAAAHEKGIVHRDLKPENLFVTRDGRVKILDFGLARLDAVAGGGGTNVQTQARNTTPGTVLGTVGYMSPEQVRGLETDHRTDIFAFGAILYEMLTGRRAFRGATAADTMSAILNDDPPETSSSTHHVSPSVDRVIRRCLEKEKSERFESARDLGFALDAVTSSGISHEPMAAAEGARARRIGVAPALAATIAVAAAAAFVGYRAAKGTAPVAMPVFAQLTFDAGVESSPAMSPDGKTFVFVKGDAPRRQMFLQRVDGRSAIALSKSPDHDDRDPAFSPDGSQIAFRSERDGGGIFVMGATGESVRRLTSSGFSPAWSPDGKTLVFASEELTSPTSRNSVSSLSVVDFATGAVRRLYDGDAMQPAFSPDGRRIAFWGIPPDGGQRDIFTLAASGDPKSLAAVTSDAALDWNPVWAPDGKSILFASDRSGTMNLWRIEVDAESGKARGEPQPLSVPATNAEQMSLSRDGRHLLYVVRTRTQQLTLATLDAERETLTTRPRPALSGSMLVRTSDPSPDGEWIALSTEARHEDIFVMRGDGSEMRQLTNDPHRDRGVSWSADGKRIVFYSTRGGPYAAWSIHPDGSGLTQLTAKSQVVYTPLFSPDGRRLASFDMTRTSIVDLSSVPTSKGDPLPPLPDGGSSFVATAWSPDGTRVAGRRWSGPSDVYVYSLAEKRYVTLAAPTPRTNGEIEWIDDRRLLFPGSDGVLYVIDTATGKTRRAGTLPEGTVRASRNGRHLVLATRNVEADVWLMATGEAAR